MRADGQTDVTKLIFAFCNFANELKHFSMLVNCSHLLMLYVGRTGQTSDDPNTCTQGCPGAEKQSAR
jgi:hypothetical protein